MYSTHHVCPQIHQQPTESESVSTVCKNTAFEPYSVCALTDSLWPGMFNGSEDPYTLTLCIPPTCTTLNFINYLKHSFTAFFAKRLEIVSLTCSETPWYLWQSYIEQNGHWVDLESSNQPPHWIAYWCYARVSNLHDMNHWTDKILFQDIFSQKNTQ